MFDKEKIKELALTNGFKLKEQPDGTMGLNPYVFEFAAALERVATAELKAQVEQLREFANDAIHFAIKRKDKVCADPMFVMQQLQNRLDTTPAQCLAEIKAQAVDDFADELIEFHNFHPYAKSVIYARECANQLRQQAKGE